MGMGFDPEGEGKSQHAEQHPSTQQYQVPEQQRSR